jgi:hypothetical protein
VKPNEQTETIKAKEHIPCGWLSGTAKPHLATLFCIFCANSLILYKYAARLTDHAWILPVLYLCFLIFISTIIPRVSVSHPARTLGGITAVFVVVYLIMLRSIDPVSVNIDRWSAITSFNDNLLTGKFPYLSMSHLNHQVSGFPGLFIMAMPFQLAGDIGYFQLVAFICFGFMVFRGLRSPSEKNTVLILAGTSPLVLLEIAARSELFTNMVLVLLVFTLCEHFRCTKSSNAMILCGICAGIVASTRGIVIIPYIVYFVRYFKKHETGFALQFITVSLIAYIATLIPFYLWNTEAFIASNPFVLQSSYIPKGLLAAAVLFSVWFGLHAKDSGQKIRGMGYILFVIVATLFLKTVIVHGWSQAVDKSSFDLTYFQFCMPFLLFGLFTDNVFPVITLRQHQEQ